MSELQKKIKNPDVMFLTVAEFATAVSVSTKTVYKWIKANHVPSKKIGKSLFIPKTALVNTTELKVISKDKE